MALGNLWVTVVTFVLAYAAGYLMTVGPLLQAGESMPTALRDAVVSETASITVMELVAASVAIVLGGRAGIGAARFWSSLVLSLSAGLVAALPINVLLVHRGIKEGMHNPQHSLEAAS
ncbi:MAG: DUF4396 domain-containing protein [Dehalococcoidia bacterium]